MDILKTLAFILSLSLLSSAAVVRAEQRPNIAMLEYAQVFDKSGRSLDLVLEGASSGWHCETVDSNGVGHNCTLKTSTEEESKGVSKRYIKVISHRKAIDVNDPLYLTGGEEYLKDWQCEWVDSKGVGHDCDWFDVIVTDD